MRRHAAGSVRNSNAVRVALAGGDRDKGSIILAMAQQEEWSGRGWSHGHGRMRIRCGLCGAVKGPAPGSRTNSSSTG